MPRRDIDQLSSLQKFDEISRLYRNLARRELSLPERRRDRLPNPKTTSVDGTSSSLLHDCQLYNAVVRVATSSCGHHDFHSIDLDRWSETQLWTICSDPEGHYWWDLSMSNGEAQVFIDYDEGTRELEPVDLLSFALAVSIPDLILPATANVMLTANTMEHAIAALEDWTEIGVSGLQRPLIQPRSFRLGSTYCVCSQWMDEFVIWTGSNDQTESEQITRSLLGAGMRLL